VQGITLELLAAEEGALVEIAIDKDDTTELKQNIQAFVADFNSASDLINEQFVVNDATGSTGPLAGDSTIRNLQARLRNLISSRIEGLDEGLNSLVLIGISFTRDARLSIDDERLNEALSENLDKVRALFVAQGNTVGAGV
jgi:flagellar hook-associated protein 2